MLELATSDNRERFEAEERKQKRFWIRFIILLLHSNLKFQDWSSSSKVCKFLIFFQILASRFFTDVDLVHYPFWILHSTAENHIYYAFNVEIYCFQEQFLVNVLWNFILIYDFGSNLCLQCLIFPIWGKFYWKIFVFWDQIFSGYLTIYQKVNFFFQDLTCKLWFNLGVFKNQFWFRFIVQSLYVVSCS